MYATIAKTNKQTNYKNFPSPMGGQAKYSNNNYPLSSTIANRE